ncbi:MAG: sugar phosphate isomerase/epimerase [Chloroflexi bacterium]|nr:sugar phosphate isomerase/epimerase [Chloroflexota bacterium]
MRFGYNSNGLKCHSAVKAVQLVADRGYDAIELAFQREHLDPLRASPADVARLRSALRERDLGVVCGAGVPNALSDERFEPSLFHPDGGGRAARRRFLRASLEIAAELGARLLVFCTGTPRENVNPESAWQWLVEGLAAVCQRAEELGMAVALEPEPGHFIATLDDYRRLRTELGQTSFGLTADVGHVYCTEEGRPEQHFARLAREERLLHIQIDDMRDRRHAHLPFGEGEIDFLPIFRALVDAQYDGLVSVELSRHSDRASELTASSLAFLRQMEALAKSSR